MDVVLARLEVHDAVAVQQAMGLAVDSWGGESNHTSKPIGELLA